MPCFQVDTSLKYVSASFTPQAQSLVKTDLHTTLHFLTFVQGGGGQSRYFRLRGTIPL